MSTLDVIVTAVKVAVILLALLCARKGEHGVPRLLATMVLVAIVSGFEYRFPQGTTWEDVFAGDLSLDLLSECLMSGMVYAGLIVSLFLLLISPVSKLQKDWNTDRGN